MVVASRNYEEPRKQGVLGIELEPPIHWLKVNFPCCGHEIIHLLGGNNPTIEDECQILGILLAECRGILAEIFVDMRIVSM